LGVAVTVCELPDANVPALAAVPPAVGEGSHRRSFHGEIEIASVKLSDWLLVLFNFLLTVFTGYLWWSTRTLWRVTQQIADYQAQDTSALQRAYISTEGGNIEQIRTGDFVGYPLIRNVGRLPAMHIRWLIDMTASNDENWRPPTVNGQQGAPQRRSAGPSLGTHHSVPSRSRPASK
jgi:hypothetical protein